MSFLWFTLIGLSAWGGGLLFAFALCNVSGHEDRAARELEDYFDQSANVAAAELKRILHASATSAGSVSTAPVSIPG
jgi:hypothetical protein